MSLSVDGFWKAGFWSQTFWADGFWFEGAPVAPSVIIYGGDGHPVKKKKRKKLFDQIEKTLLELIEGEQEYAVVESGSIQPVKTYEVETILKTLQELAGENDMLLYRIESLRNRIRQQEQHNALLLEEEDELLLF